MLASDPREALHRSAMSAIRPMTESEFVAWRDETIPAYAEDKVASGQWSRADAADLSRKEFEELLPRGIETPDNHLFTIVDDDGQAVGTLWFAIQARSGAKIAYVYDVVVAPEHRRRGHAQRAFKALEDEARTRQLSGIALHVFGHNPGAQALYAKLGFHPTNISMFKRVQ